MTPSSPHQRAHPAYTFDASLFLLDTDAPSTLSEPLRAALPARSNGLSPTATTTTTAATPGWAHTPASDNSYSIVSPAQSYLAPTVSSPAHNISGNTTPGFDTLDDLDLPDFNEVYPATPSATVSPQPVVKVEEAQPGSTSSDSSGLAGSHVRIERGDDGSWRGGLDPATRGNEMLPYSLRDQEIEMKKQEKNADVEEWLRRSSVELPRRAAGLAPPAQQRRRARSVGDFRTRQGWVDGQPVGPARTEEEDDEEDEGDVVEDDSSVDSDWREGSLDDEDPQRPPSISELARAEEDEAERERRERELDPEFHPNPRQFFSQHPWNDIVAPVTRGASLGMRNQPNSANAAILKFKQYAENIETASRVATFGSNMTKGRRNSTGNADKVLGGPLKRLSFGRDKSKPPGPQRKPSIWGEFRTGLKRSLSNSGGNKAPGVGVRRINSGDKSASPFAPSILGTSFRGEKPNQKVETSTVRSAFGQMASPLMAAGAGKGSHSATPTSPLSRQPSGVPGIMHRVSRSRSKSELQRQHIFGVVTSLVGPVLPQSPPDDPSEPSPGSMVKKFTFGEESQRRGTAEARKLLSPLDAHRHELDDDGDEDMDDASSYGQVAQEEKPQKLEITPTFDGFVANVRLLTPHLGDKLVERIAQEQCKRFKKLVDHRHKHLAALAATGHCSNNQKCRPTIGAIGVSSDTAVNVTGGHKRVLSSDTGYTSDLPNSPTDHLITAAQFPPNVPTPPTTHLPASFECPICFKTKKFSKPSDWTKHVHEDVQPFTCTFPECTEPKSFKRKADWVRHENERHRHLEWWTCNQTDCTHTCYRKDNFVQHLVREHKMPEPKVKAVRKGEAIGASQTEIMRVWAIVDACHQENTKPPQSERCRFCGVSCGTWKKLTVHLARHMEALSLPILDLITDDAVVPATKPARRQQLPPQQHQQHQQHQQQQRRQQVHTPPQPVPHSTPQSGPTQQYHGQYTLSPPQPQHQRSRSMPSENFPPASSEIYTTAPPQQQQQQGIPMFNIDTGYAEQEYAPRRPQYNGYEPAGMGYTSAGPSYAATGASAGPAYAANNAYAGFTGAAYPMAGQTQGQGSYFAEQQQQGAGMEGWGM